MAGLGWPGVQDECCAQLPLLPIYAGPHAGCLYLEACRCRQLREGQHGDIAEQQPGQQRRSAVVLHAKADSSCYP